jgi:hypothetical protein
MIFCNIDEEIEERLEYRTRFSDVIPSDFKLQRNGIAFISFDKEYISCVMSYRKTGRVATQVDRITFRFPIILEQKIKINDIIDYFSNNLKSHFQRQTENHITVLSEKVEKKFLSFFKESYPDLYDEIEELKLRLENNIPYYSHKAEEIIALEKDALNIVFKMFNFEESDLPVWSSNDDSAPFLNGYSHLTIREDPMINHDSQVFGDWSIEKQFVQGAVEFMKENQKITLMNVNRQPLEKTLGVDLLIYHHTFKSYIMIQYKRMVKENDQYIYRPNDSTYDSEIKRMIDFTQELSSQVNDSIENYRLNNELFYFKLCPARIENLNSKKMVSGMYIPLKLWTITLADKSTDGPKGGKQLSFKNTGRYFYNSQFINLAQNGWIGTRISDSDKITELIKSSIDSNNSLTIAKYELI